jgi:4-amino-4-deoxy-L-arabinose transferase-like glycosyltransferase
MPSENKKTVVFLLIMPLIGCGVLLFATRWGIGNASDSAIYIGAARNLLAGKGLTVPFGITEDVPLTHYPPLFPALLAGTGLLGVDPMVGARWLQALLFGANIFLVGLVIRKHTRDSLWASATGSFLVLSSSVVLIIHAWALSEPVFILLGLLGLLLLADYLERENPSLLVASSAAMGLAFLSRYTGAALVGTGLAALLLFSKRALYGKMRDCVVFGGISIMPVGLWAVRNLDVAGSATNRQIFAHPIGWVHLRQALVSVSTWAAPPRTPVPIAVFILLTGIGCLVILHFALRRRTARAEEESQSSMRISHILAVFILCYALLLAVSISFFDAHTTLDSRILSPIYLSLLFIIVGLGSSVWNAAEGKRSLRMGLVAVAFVFSCFHVYHGGAWVLRAHANGLGFATEMWRDNEFIRQIQALPTDAPIYSNGMDAVYIVAGRLCRNLPAKMSPATLQPNFDYSRDLYEMGRELEKCDGAIVYFKGNVHRYYFPTEEELAAHLPLRMTVETPEGAIYRIRRTP